VSAALSADAAASSSGKTSAK